MNLFKVERLCWLSNKVIFPGVPRMWKAINYGTDDEENIYGITVLAESCVAYINGEMYVDLDKFNEAVNVTFLLDYKHFYKHFYDITKEKIKDNLKLKLITLSEKYSIFFAPNGNIEKYIKYAGCENAEIVSANEFIIKKLLE